MTDTSPDLASRVATIDVPASMRRNVTLAPFTTFGIGGPADLFIEPRSSDELVTAIRWARNNDIPWFVLGTGANILVGDGGVEGLVIRNCHSDASFEGDRLTAGSGAVVDDLIVTCLEHGLSGIEHYSGIPSTLGGAMWQNLHFLAPDRTRTAFIAEVVTSARVLLDTDEIIEADHGWFEFGYDTSILHAHHHIVLDVTLQLQPESPERIAEIRASNLNWRAEKHPAGATTCSAGSIFQKLEGIGAGRLIDHAGLKGTRIGGAEVSPHHANFILNAGGATARDVRDLIAHVRQTVIDDSGHELHPEISFIGRFH